MTLHGIAFSTEDLTHEAEQIESIIRLIQIAIIEDSGACETVLQTLWSIADGHKDKMQELNEALHTEIREREECGVQLI